MWYVFIVLNRTTSTLYCNLNLNRNVNLPSRGIRCEHCLYPKAKRGWLRAFPNLHVGCPRGIAPWPVIRAFEHESIEPKLRISINNTCHEKYGDAGGWTEGGLNAFDR